MRPAWRETAVVVAVFLLLQGLALLAPELGVVDPEEGMTPVQATVLGWIDPRDVVLYQYRPFCGGCTLAALAYRPVLIAVGDAVWGWKLVLVPFQLAWLIGGGRLADALAGTWARRAFHALAMLSPWLVTAASWRGWTNHYEATAVAVLAASFLVGARPRPWLGGVLLGLSVVVSLSGLVGVVATAGALLLARRGPVLLRALAASSWAVLPWAWIASRTPLDLPTGAGAGVGARLAALVDPLRLGATFGAPGVATGLLGVGAVAAALGVAGRGAARLPALGLGVWALGWTLGGVDVDPIRALVPDPLLIEDARYGVVPAMLGLLAVATAVGALADAGRTRLAGVLLAAALAPGVVARAELLVRDDLTAAPLWHGHAPAWDTFRLQWLAPGLRAPAWTCPPGDVACADLAAYRDERRAVDPAEAALRRPRDEAETPTSTVEAWALGRSALRLPVGARPVPVDPAAALVWARGYGQSWGARRGTTERPAGFDGWSAGVQASFVLGAAEGDARPWWPRTPGG